MNPLPPVTPAQYATVIVPVLSFVIGLAILGTYLWKSWRKRQPLVVKQPLQVTTRKRKDYVSRDEFGVEVTRLDERITKLDTETEEGRRRIYLRLEAETKAITESGEHRTDRILAKLDEMRAETKADMGHFFDRLNKTDNALAELRGEFRATKYQPTNHA